MASNRKPDDLTQSKQSTKSETVRYIHDSHDDVPRLASFSILRSDFSSPNKSYSYPHRYTEKQNEDQDIASSLKMTPSSHS